MNVTGIRSLSHLAAWLFLCDSRVNYEIGSLRYPLLLVLSGVLTRSWLWVHSFPPVPLQPLPFWSTSLTSLPAAASLLEDFLRLAELPLLKCTAGQKCQGINYLGALIRVVDKYSSIFIYLLGGTTLQRMLYSAFQSSLEMVSSNCLYSSNLLDKVHPIGCLLFSITLPHVPICVSLDPLPIKLLDSNSGLRICFWGTKTNTEISNSACPGQTLTPLPLYPPVIPNHAQVCRLHT